MSAYISFAIKGKDNHFYHLGSYSRNTSCFSVFDEYTTYEKWTALTKNDIKKVKNEVEHGISFYKSKIEELKLDIDFIKTFKDVKFDEILDTYTRYKNYIKEYEEDIKEAEAVLNFCTFLTDILDEAPYSGFNTKHYLYVGYEAARDPDPEDIIEGDN